MFYFESGQFKKSYREDQAILPIRQDRIGIAVIIAIAFGGVPFILNDYLLNAVFIPALVYALAALGLNILVGYCGQISLGTGAFLAVGAYSSYKLMTAFPELSFILVILLSGGVTAAVGMLFGLPSLRIKGFYLAVATLAAQFFIIWLFNKVGWFYNDNATGQISAPPREVFGFQITGPAYRHGRGDDFHHLARGCRSRRSFQYRSVISCSVHGHHRRPGIDPWILPRCLLHDPHADCTEADHG